MEILELKLVLMGVIFFSTTLVGISPILLKGACGARIKGVLSHSVRSRLLSCASCFSAGVFLFVCFMGLLPAADTKFHHILQRLAEEDSSLERFSEFPWGFFVVTCGFLVIFTIDKLVHAFEISRQKRHEQSDSHSKGGSESNSSSSTPVSDVTLLSIKGSPSPMTTPLTLTDPSLQPSDPNTTPTLEEYVANTLRETQQKEQGKTNLRYSSNGGADSNKNGTERSVEFQLQLSQNDHHGKVLATEACVILEKHEASSGHGVPSSLIFLVALGIHSLFEGAAIGLQTEQEKVLEFGVAVLVHEVVMAFTFGLEVSRSRRLTWVWQMVYVGLFTVSIPLGIAAGAGTLHNTNTQRRELVAAVLEAIATGIFLHVIFIEVLAKEFPEHHHNHEHHSTPSNNNNNHHQSQHNHHHHHQPQQQQQQQPIVNYQTISASDTDDETGGDRKQQPTHILTLGSSDDSDAENSKKRTGSSEGPSEVRLIIEKILCICAGLLTLILLNVFMHSHH